MQTVTWRLAPLCLAIGLLAHAPAQAASTIQLAFTGTPEIKGLSTTEGFKGAINVDSFQWGVGVGVSLTGGIREAGAPLVSEITWTQGLDSSYNGLSKALVRGDTYDSTFSFLRPGGGGQAPAPYLSFATGTSVISGLSLSSGGDRPSVSASEAFRNFNMTYYDQTRSGTTNKVEVGYNGLTNEKTGPTSRTTSGGSGGGPASGLYLKLGSGADAIYGDSTAQHYENWIQLSSAQMGMGITVTPDGEGFSVSNPSISELTVTQAFDGAVPAILSNLLRGTNIGTATLEFVQGGVRGPVTYMQLELDNVIFSGLAISSGGDLPSVSESLNFSGFTQRIWDIKPDGSRGEADVFSFDIVHNMVRDNGASQPSSLTDFGAGMVGPLPSAAPIPEPHAWALMAGGIAMLALLRRRRAV